MPFIVDEKFYVLHLYDRISGRAGAWCLLLAVAVQKKTRGFIKAYIAECSLGYQPLSLAKGLIPQTMPRLSRVGVY